jgi:hypothetical protein
MIAGDHDGADAGPFGSLPIRLLPARLNDSLRHARNTSISAFFGSRSLWAAPYHGNLIVQNGEMAKWKKHRQ